MQSKIIKEIILTSEEDFPLFYINPVESEKGKIGEGTKVKIDSYKNGIQFNSSIDYKIYCLPKL